MKRDVICFCGNGMFGCDYALKYWLTYFKHFFIRFMGLPVLSWCCLYKVQ